MMILLSPDQHFMNNLFSQRVTAATLVGCCTYISASFIIEKLLSGTVQLINFYENTHELLF